MARIPIAQIPNAVRMLPGGPVDVPRVNGNEVAQSLGKVARAGQQEEMSLDAFSGEAKGMEGLARGISNLGEGLGAMGRLQAQIQRRAAEERVNYQVIEGRAKLEAAYDGYKAGIPEGADPTQIVEGWAKSFPKTLSAVTGDKTLAPEAKQKLMQHAGLLDIQAKSQLGTFAQKLTFQRSKQATVELATQQMEAGRLPEAIETVEGLRKKLLIDEPAADKLIDDFKRKTESNQLEHALTVDPFKADEMLSERISQTGKTKDSTLTVDQIQTYRRQAESLKNRKRTEIFGEIKDLVDLNRVGSKKDIIAHADGKLDDTAIEMLDQRRLGKQFDPEFYLQVWKDANEWDENKDPTGAKRMSLDIRIGMLPDGMRDGPRSRLNAAKAPNYELQKQYSKQINQALEAGMFGNVSKTKAKENGVNVTKPADPVAFMAAHDKAAETQVAFHEWAKANPKAKPEEARAWLSERLNAAARAKAASDPAAKQPWWNRPIDTLWNAVVPGAGTPTGKGKEVLQKNSGKLGKITDYGQPDDPTPDSLTRAGKSAIGLLTPNSMAVSRDVEAQMKEAGINIGDKVRVKLADGTELVRIWDDRTAKTYKGKPVTGRFDLYSPDGRHAKRDVAVIGFERA